MITFPKAKINLGLRVTAKRDDGFHDIETVLYPVRFCDALEFVPSRNGVEADRLVVTGLSTRIQSDKNLVMQASAKLRKKYPFPYLKIHLHKAIPVGAGLGGGSSDAAGMLRAIKKCFSLQVSEQELKEIALEIGSDCPFFIESVPSFATGRGEILKPVKPVLQGYYVVLVNPRISISTRIAYHNSRPQVPENSLEDLLDHPIAEWKDLIINDFEDYVFLVYPQIGTLKIAIYNTGALFSSMSGSGSTIYGIFPEIPIIPEHIKKYVIYEGWQ
ncbi:MAG: 4-(cytidine 5'-diphospho)-2-C-methyl-D-erythritol kinase [Bacteroidales bacterium]|nr:4-(cytidine 5'-diphospho)-2-C-methyl-D-erythritol kinase [Bacteroidales bacterium]